MNIPTSQPAMMAFRKADIVTEDGMVQKIDIDNAENEGFADPE